MHMLHSRDKTRSGILKLGKTMSRRTIVATMKDEAPYILEWVAYHKCIGFDRFIIYSNDSTDGTTEILDALSAANEIEHIHHVVKDTDVIDKLIPKRVNELAPFDNDDWIIWIDADEFLNIHVGDGRVDDLIDEIGAAQGMCIGWRLFGDSGQQVFDGRFISETYTRCAPEKRAWYNVKTLFKYDEHFRILFNHKPIMKPEFWDTGKAFLNAAGEPMPITGDMMQRWKEGKRRGKIDGDQCSWDKAQINHYAVRTHPLFQYKISRGSAGEDQTGETQRYQQQYFNRMNTNNAVDKSILRWQERVTDEINRLLDVTCLRHNYTSLIENTYDPSIVLNKQYPEPASPKPDTDKIISAPKFIETSMDFSEHRPPRIMIATCMKDEGPFILEWIAWHKSIGVDDIVVFTNDCSDGTTEILDRLEDLGEVLHLPNPAVATGDTKFQPIALNYVQHMRQFKEADYFISMDVDEFINIHVGNGHLYDLIKTAGPFDVLSMTELNHGSNGYEEFERGWVTERFVKHEVLRPGLRKSRRGIKSIVKISPKLVNIRNHRPDMRRDFGEVKWFNGSGNSLDYLVDDNDDNGIDCRLSYEMVTLEHYALRSLHSYIAKMFRGDVVVANKQVSQRYWRLRNRNESDNSAYGPHANVAKNYYNTLIQDKNLLSLHERSCDHHENTIRQLIQKPEYIERINWIKGNAWVSREELLANE